MRPESFDGRPRRFPLPVWLFERSVGTDETAMWRWLASNQIDLNTQPTRELHPDAFGVQEWLSRQSVSRPDPATTPRRTEGPI